VNPGSTWRIAMNVRIISPETISNVSANATIPIPLLPPDPDVAVALAAVPSMT
jgi:hypothetical protein